MLKKLYLAYLFNKDTSVQDKFGNIKLIPDGTRSIPTFLSKEEAETHSQQLALTDPTGQVVIFEAVKVIEPKKVEFVHKIFNDKGELIV